MYEKQQYATLTHVRVQLKIVEESEAALGKAQVITKSFMKQRIENREYHRINKLNYHNLICRCLCDSLQEFYKGAAAAKERKQVLLEQWDKYTKQLKEIEDEGTYCGVYFV